MANVIKKATNKFTKGLVMDFSPENTKNEVLTHALNAALLTFNGNELSLQNDMGNGRVETAYLPEGYMPVGTCEYGGIVYIVSYNPLEDKSLIGCFPSPERNISKDELGESFNTSLSWEDFLEYKYIESATGLYVKNGQNYTIPQSYTDGVKRYERVPNGDLTQVSQKVLLRNNNLNPGDKFIVYANEEIYNERLLDLYKFDGTEFIQINNPMLSLNLVSILDDGKIIYLNNDVRKYDVPRGLETFKYHILGQTLNLTTNKKIDVDSYRNILSSGYNVFKEKNSGKLAILAELVTIDSFALTHSIILDTVEDPNFYKFKIMIYPEVYPELNKDNYYLVSKLKYYYLEKSKQNLGANYTSPFDDIKLSDILTSNEASILGILEDTTMGKLDFKFPNEKTYHKLNHIEFKSGKKYKISGRLLKLIKNKYLYINPTFYDLDLLTVISNFNNVEDDTFYYLEASGIISNEEFNVNVEENDILGNSSEDIYIHTSDFLVNLETYKYDEIELATFKLPKKLIDAGINFPFKYDYTLVPCMEYGKLKHLEVSNTIDLNNLHNFNKSNFNTWKYRIDGELLMLTFGAEIFDTFEHYKVSGLFLEFYDWRGFAGSIEISNKKSYSGKFTKLIQLNTPGSINNKKLKIKEDGYGTFINTFNKNINIFKNEEFNKYYYNDIEVVYVNDDLGWYVINADTSDLANYVWDSELKKYIITENGQGTHKITALETLNDCGILYSNVIYGVKPYLLVQESDNKIKCISKGSLVLFTFPFLNDYFYKLENFDDILNPKLQLFTTYLLKDSSTIKPYDVDVTYTEGYNEDDYNKVLTYKLGKSESNTSIELSRKFITSGNTDIKLLVGLHKDYELCGISCDESINDGFSVLLELVDLEDSYSVIYEKPSSSKLDVSMHFTNEDTVLDITNLLLYNITEGNLFVNINYNFNYKYNLKINDITASYTPANVVCALFHKQDDNQFNYEDFNIRKSDEGLLSDLVYYNSGGENITVFGVARMDSANGYSKKMDLEVISYYLRSGTSTDNSTPGSLNSGEYLKDTISFLGKLSFCLPHAHGVFSGNYVNIDNDYVITNSISDKLLNKPIYNMCVNTESSVDWNNPFISVIHTEKIGESNYKYTGLSSDNIKDFNRNLLDIMSLVYAYNPDYTLHRVNSGNIEIEDGVISVTSHLFAKNAKMNDENKFNDFIKMGTVSFSKYLYELNNYVSIKDKPLVLFKPDYTYCGTDALPYLITQLTYNILPPQQLIDDLTIDLTKDVIIRHSDSSFDVLTGDLNKNYLYGWDNNSLFRLDVTNYTIDKSLDIPKISFKSPDVIDSYFNCKINEYTAVYAPGEGKSIYQLKNFECSVGDESFELEINNVKTSMYFVESVGNFKYLYIVCTHDYGSKILILPKDASVQVTLEATSIRTGYSDSIAETANNLLYSIKTGRFSNGNLVYTGNTITINGLTSTTFIRLCVNTEKITLESNIIYNMEQFTNYYEYSRANGKETYDVLDDYLHCTLPYSNITINDLVYKPNITGHRLFIKDYLYVKSRLAFTYRYEGESTSSNKNTLLFFAGPSYIPKKNE